MCTYSYIYMLYVYICIYSYIYIYVVYICAYTLICIYIYAVYMHILLYTNIYIYTCIYSYIYICVCVVYIYICIHARYHAWTGTLREKFHIRGACISEVVPYYTRYHSTFHVNGLSCYLFSSCSLSVLGYLSYENTVYIYIYIYICVCVHVLY